MSSTIVISRATIDTNILIYAVDRRNQAKHEIAERVVGAFLRDGNIILLQALNEFFRAVTRKGLLSKEEAVVIVNAARGIKLVIATNEHDLAYAMDSYERHNLQFFDQLLIATARRVGCTVLISEDMQHECIYDGLTVLNPFKLSAEALDRLLA